MFVVIIKYIKPIEQIDASLATHRAFLDRCYTDNLLIASGPQNPRTGGILLSQLTDRGQLETLLKDDPFLTNDLATYEIIEFSPVKWHPGFAEFV